MKEKDLFDFINLKYSNSKSDYNVKRQRKDGKIFNIHLTNKDLISIT